jgi:hypothetical protein
MPPYNHFITKKGVRKGPRGGFYEKSDKEYDPDDFQFYRKGKKGKTSDVCEEERVDRLFDLYLHFIIQRINGSSRG